MVFGTGVQAIHHLRALSSIYPSSKVFVRGTSAESARSFCNRHGDLNLDLQPLPPGPIPEDVQVVITVTSSSAPIYDEPAVAGRLVVAVGAFTPEMAEIGQVTLDGSDIYVDDIAGARHEAGDLLQAGIDFGRVLALSSAIHAPARHGRAVVFKSLGCAAWDLAACRVAMDNLGLRLKRAGRAQGGEQ